MAKDVGSEFTEWAPGDPAPPLYDKAARRAERARQARLSRLPFLYDWSLQSPGRGAAAAVLQTLLVISAVLVPARLLTGRWLPPFIALAVLGVSFALQALNRYLNAQAGRS